MAAGQIITIAALATGLGIPGAAPARADAPAGTSQPKKAKLDTSRRICRNLVPTGSRMSGRICRTQAEWDKSMDKSQQGLLRHQTTEQTGYAH
jgi:hypothetical protein